MGLEYDLPKQMCSSSREEKSRLFMFMLFMTYMARQTEVLETHASKQG